MGTEMHSYIFEDGQGEQTYVNADSLRVQRYLKLYNKKDIINKCHLMSSGVTRTTVMRANEERKELVKQRGMMAKALKDEEEKRKADEEGWAAQGGWAVFGKLIADIKDVSKHIKQIQDTIMEWMDAGALNL